MEALIPQPVTDMDRRVNRAYELAQEDGLVRWVWVEGEYVVIGVDRPPGVVAVGVHPEGFAMVLAPEAEPPWQES